MTTRDTISKRPYSITRRTTGRLRPSLTSIRFVLPSSPSIYPSSTLQLTVAQQHEIADRHRLYLHEHKPDFNHRSDEWYTADEIEDQYHYECDYPDDEDLDPEEEEAEKNFIHPVKGHNPFAEYLATGMLQHKPGICRCPNCGWLWDYIGGAFTKAIDARELVDGHKLCEDIILELDRRGVDMSTVDAKVLADGVGKEVESFYV
jgi:hypothetical protein